MLRGMAPIPGIDLAERRRRRRRRAILARFAGITLVLVGIGAGTYLLILRRLTPVAEAPPAVPEPMAPGAAPPGTQALARPGTTLPVTPEQPLPSLAESDPFVRGLLSGLTRQPPPAAWLSTDGLIERFVAAVDNIASGESPRPNLRFLAPSQKFEVLRRRDRIYVDPASYERYDTIAELISSVDPQRAVELYRQIAPLCEEAYRGLGHAQGGFDQAFTRAIRMLLATPIVEGEVELTPQVITFAFADTTLEDLTASQKHLLRMGPRNVRRIEAELRVLAIALGVPEGDLPAEVVHRAASG